MIKYMDIVEYDDKNSDDFSLTIFFSHCDFRCEGCQNPSTQSGEVGSEFTKDIEEYIINFFKNNKMCTNLVLSGGDPLSTRNRDEVLKFLERLKKAKPQINVWVYTGYTLDRFTNEELKDIDYIKCGTYQNKLSTKDNVQYGIKLATSNQILYRLFKGD